MSMEDERIYVENFAYKAIEEIYVEREQHSVETNESIYYVSEDEYRFLKRNEEILNKILLEMPNSKNLKFKFKRDKKNYIVIFLKHN